MTLDELVGVLEDMRDRAAQAAPPVAMEMARVYSAHLSHVTLRRTEATPGQFGSPAPPGSPPAYRMGVLAGSVTHWPGPSSGLSALAYAGPHTIYAATQEYGAVHFARDHPYMRWHNDGGWWAKKRVEIPARPYMQPAVAEVVADGSVQRAAALMFRSLVGHY
mgnify:CR=1 FL=1